MDFAKERLQNLIGFQLDVGYLLDFLRTLGASQRLRLDEFFSKWKTDAYATKLMMAYVSGAWKPETTAHTREIRHQHSWEEYADKHLKTPTVPKWQLLGVPFTFSELIQHDFWKNVYTTFGHRVTSFILEKAVLFFEAEPQLLILIAWVNCNLQKKITQLARNGSAFNGRSTFNYTWNPYALDKFAVAPLPATHEEKLIQKRKRGSSELEVDADATLPKRIKVDDTDTTGAMIATTTESCNQGIHGLIRWFRPNAKLLKLIIREREKRRRPSIIGDTSNARIECQMPQLNFVGIVEDAEFIKSVPLGVIQKQYRPVDMNLRRSFKEWQGLVIPEPSPPSPNRKYNVNVYLVSEEFARTHNIRVHVKQRRKRKITGRPESNLDIVDDEPNETFDDRPFSSFNQPFIPSGFEPYNPQMALVTLSALYNKSSWSCWPSRHVLKTIKASSITVEEGVRLLVSSILETDVGSPNYPDIGFLLDSQQFESKLYAIVRRILIFHRRVKDIHGFVKRCVTNWMIKTEEKKISKEKHSIKRKEYRLFHPRRETSRIIHQRHIFRCKSLSQTVDLTSDTSSTSTHFTPPMDLFVNRSSTGLITQDHFPSQNTPCNIISKGEITAKAYARLKEQIPYSCITMMLKQLLKTSGLDTLLGSKRNIRSFFRFVRKSLILGGTRSGLQLGQMMAELDSEACDWIPKELPSMVRTQLLAKIAKWIFCNYILVIMKVSFYITEVSNSRLHAVFFLREAWKSITERVRDRLQRCGTLKYFGILTKSKPVRSRRTSEGINSRIRFLPKNHFGLRPIITFKRQANRWLELQAKLMIDSSVMTNYSHRTRRTCILNQRWKKFLKEWRDLNSPRLYFVRADVQDAYPSVDAAKLREILNNVCHQLQSVDIKDFTAIGRSKVIYRRAAVSHNCFEAWTSSIVPRPCLIYNNVKNNITLNPINIISKVYPFANENVLRIGYHKYEFKQGLPQGWPLSETYCNAYYGAMDKQYFDKFLNNAGEFFKTTVDDYLYITPNAGRAAKFLRILETGIPSYNCKFNAKKILTNLHPTVGVPVPLQECDWVSFYGCLFCLTCGHVMRDLSPYCGQDIASTLSFRIGKASGPESFIKSRMRMMLAARLQDYMLDPSINCKSRMVLNIWEAGLMFAFRYYAICRVIYPNLNILQSPERAKANVAAIIGCATSLQRHAEHICDTIRRTSVDLFDTSNPKCTRNNNNICPCLKSYHLNDSTPSSPPNINITASTPTSSNLSLNEIIYIVYRAFILKLSQHSSVFGKEVLPRLHKITHVRQALLGRQSVAYLDSILGDGMPLSFQNIKI